MVRAPKERKDKRPFSVRRDIESIRATPVGTIITDNGSLYVKRRNGSVVPKVTTIKVDRTLKRILEIFKEKGQYPSYNELLLELIGSRVESKSLPKILLIRAEWDRELHRLAREKALEKYRYYYKKYKDYLRKKCRQAL